MARVPKSSLLSALSGSVGGELVFKKYKDKTVVSKFPDMERIEASPRQRVQRDKMRAAQAYWKKVKRDAGLRGAYEQGLQPGERLYNKVIGEFMRKGGL